MGKNRGNLFRAAAALALFIVLVIQAYRIEDSRTEIRVACVGDSITYGSGIRVRDRDSYPRVLQKLLGHDYQVQNFGVSGRTAMWMSNKPYVKEQMYRNSLEFEPDIVVLKFGTNDSKWYNWQGAEVFKAQYRELIESYQKLASQPRIYLCTPASAYYVDGRMRGKMKYDIEGLVVRREVVPAVVELADEMQLGLIDIHKVTMGHPEWFERDGIHPNEDGARAIAEEVGRVLKEDEESIKFPKK